MPASCTAMWIALWPVERFIDRAETDPVRLRAHPDWEIVKAMDMGTFDWDGFEPMDLEIPILKVETTKGYSPTLDEVVNFCSASLGASLQAMVWRPAERALPLTLPDVAATELGVVDADRLAHGHGCPMTCG